MARRIRANSAGIGGLRGIRAPPVARIFDALQNRTFTTKLFYFVSNEMEPYLRNIMEEPILLTNTLDQIGPE